MDNPDSLLLHVSNLLDNLDHIIHQLFRAREQKDYPIKRQSGLEKRLEIFPAFDSLLIHFQSYGLCNASDRPSHSGLGVFWNAFIKCWRGMYCTNCDFWNYACNSCLYARNSKVGSINLRQYFLNKSDLMLSGISSSNINDSLFRNDRISSPLLFARIIQPPI